MAPEAKKDPNELITIRRKGQPDGETSRQTRAAYDLLYKDDYDVVAEPGAPTSAFNPGSEAAVAAAGKGDK